MKKTTILSALALCLLASCAQDDGLTNPTDGLVPVALSVNIADSMNTRANNSNGDPEAQRCYVQIMDGKGKAFAAGHPFAQAMLMDRNSGTEFVKDGVLIYPNTDYTFLFWADSEKDDATNAITDLTAVDYVVNSVAYIGRTEKKGTGETTPYRVECKLNHVVTKVTLQTTADLPAGRAVSLTIPDVYTKYNVNKEEGGDPNSVMYYYTSEVVNTAVPALNESAGQNGHVLSCYVIMNNGTRDITINHDGLSKTIELITLPMNGHVTIKGDVSRVGYSDFTYTVTTESLGGTSAGYDETWGSTIPDLPFEKLDLTKGAITITDDGTYHITSNGATTTNAITVSGNISPKIYISDLKMAVSSGSAISITDGANATIHVLGTGNSVSSDNNTGVAVSDGATVIIEGSSTSDVLTANGGGDGGAGIGSPLSGATAGNVIITNVTVNATGGGKNSHPYYLGGAGIGSSSSGNCGDITITDAVINANGGDYSPGIGLGYANTTSPSIGKITITNSDVTAKAGYYASAIGLPYSEGVAGAEPDYKVGQIIITTDNLETFLSKLTTGGTANPSFATYAQRIGVGSHVNINMYSPSILNQDGSGPWEGVVINGTAYPDGYE